MENLSTLGDGGLQFQPTPESGQVSGPVSQPYICSIRIYGKKRFHCMSGISKNFVKVTELLGYVLLADLKLYTAPPPPPPPVQWDRIPSIIEVHNIVKQSGFQMLYPCADKFTDST